MDADVTGRVRAIVIAVEHDLLPREVAEAWDLLDANEPRLALELVATQLVEHEVEPTAAVVADVRAACEAMGLDDRYWGWLTPGGSREDRGRAGER